IEHSASKIAAQRASATWRRPSLCTRRRPWQRNVSPGGPKLQPVNPCPGIAAAMPILNKYSTYGIFYAAPRPRKGESHLVERIGKRSIAKRVIAEVLRLAVT